MKKIKASLKTWFKKYISDPLISISTYVRKEKQFVIFSLFLMIASLIILDSLFWNDKLKETIGIQIEEEAKISRLDIWIKLAVLLPGIYTLFLLIKRTKTQEEILKQSQRNHTETLFNNAVGYLAQKNNHIRMSGIELLDNLAKEHKDYCEKVCRMFISYLRLEPILDKKGKKDEAIYAEWDEAIGKAVIDEAIIDEAIIDEAIIESKNKIIKLLFGEGDHYRKNADSLQNGAYLSKAKLEGTNLGRAKLQGAQLQGADLSKAQLQGADLGGAQLQDAKLELAQLQNADLESAGLKGADLGGAKLQGTNLKLAQLQNANLERAQLEGAILEIARLQGAFLGSAQLQNADLRGAQLQNAYLINAQLQNADLRSAQLQGAILERARLQGANLTTTELQGAYLYHTQLQGADLSKAQLQGTDLFGTQLQGADLSSAQLQGADLKGVPVTGASSEVAQLQGAFTNEDTSTSYRVDIERRITSRIGKNTEIKNAIFSGGMRSHTVDRIVNIISKFDPNRANALRQKLEKHIDKEPSYQVPPEAITGKLTQEEAEKIIKEYNNAMKTYRAYRKTPV